MSNYNSTLQNNTTTIQNLIDMINELPEAGSTEQATPVITVGSNGLITATAGEKSATKQLTTQAAKTITPSTSSQTAVSSGVYTTGAVTVAGDANLIAANIAKGVSIFGVTGTHSGESSSSSVQVTITSEESEGIATYVLSGQITTSAPVNLGYMLEYSIEADLNSLIIVNSSKVSAGVNCILIESADTYTIFQVIAYATTCCFVAGTQVLTSLDGETAPIEFLREGDPIVSYNIVTKENYIAKVNGLIVKEDTTDIAEVYFDNGSFITMNAYHPIYTENGFHSLTNYNGYDTLTVGDICKTVDGWAEITAINRYISDPIITYNLDVVDIGENPDDEANDTFYANGITVHNGFQC